MAIAGRSTSPTLSPRRSRRYSASPTSTPDRFPGSPADFPSRTSIDSRSSAGVGAGGTHASNSDLKRKPKRNSRDPYQGSSPSKGKGAAGVPRAAGAGGFQFGALETISGGGVGGAGEELVVLAADAGSPMLGCLFNPFVNPLSCLFSRLRIQG